MSRRVLEWAKFYASWGAIPIPAYGIRFDANGKVIGCTCRRSECTPDKWGKHPMSRGWNTITAPQDGVRLVAEALKRDPDLNICLATGPSGLLVVDLDVKEVAGVWVDGGQSFLEMVGDRELPEAPYQHSGGGGHHIFFSVPIDPKLELQPKKFDGGVEFKTGKSLVHVYPSRHKSGGTYRWNPPPSLQLLPPPAPEWMVEMAKATSVKDARGEQTIRITGEELRKLAKRWSQSAGVDKSRNGASLGALAGFGLNDTKSHERLEHELPDGSRTRLLLLTQALAESHSQIRAECVLETLKPAIEWRQARGYSTGFADLCQMLRDAQQKARTARAGWRQDLIYNEAGKVTACLANVYSFLRYHIDWDGVLAFDERSNAPVYLKAPPFRDLPENATYPRPIPDDDAVSIVQWFSRTQQMAVAKSHVTDSLITACRNQKCFDPVKEYFEGLAWDGVSRLDGWLQKYVGAEESVYTTRVGATYLISAVARTYEPGCKVDHVMVFEGAQGFKKSTLFRNLVPKAEWFTDSKIDLESKDAYLQLASKLIVELAELASVKRATQERVKSYVSSPIDTFRPPYGRASVSVPRRSIFGASTNEERYFVDDENRRFWPIVAQWMGQDVIDDLAENRDQLWAEAVARYKEGAIWWLTEEEEELARAQQDVRRDVYDDPYWDVLEDKLSRAIRKTPEEAIRDDVFAAVDGKTLVIVDNFVTSMSLLTALEIPLERRSTGAAKRIGRVMKARGWYPDRVGPTRGYRLDPEAVLPIFPDRPSGVRKRHLHVVRAAE